MKAQQQNIYTEKLREYLIEMELGPFVKWRENIVLGFIILIGILGLAYLIFLGPFDMFRPAAHVQENVIMDPENVPPSEQKVVLMDSSLTDNQQESEAKEDKDSSLNIPAAEEKKITAKEKIAKPKPAVKKPTVAADKPETKKAPVTKANKGKVEIVNRTIQVNGDLEAFSKLTFNIPDYNPNSRYSINFGDGKIRKIGKGQINHAYADAGTYNVTVLEYLDSGSIKKYQSTLTITD